MALRHARQGVTIINVSPVAWLAACADPENASQFPASTDKRIRIFRYLKAYCVVFLMGWYHRSIVSAACSRGDCRPTDQFRVTDVQVFLMFRP